MCYHLCYWQNYRFSCLHGGNSLAASIALNHLLGAYLIYLIYSVCILSFISPHFSIFFITFIKKISDIRVTRIIRHQCCFLPFFALKCFLFNLLLQCYFCYFINNITNSGCCFIYTQLIKFNIIVKKWLL